MAAIECLGDEPEAYGGIGQSEEGLHVLTEALAAVEKTGGRFYEAELYRLRGELLLAPIYSWFTEGFDTADLREARGLLEAAV